MRLLFTLLSKKNDERLIRSLSENDIKKRISHTAIALTGLSLAHIGAMMKLENLSIMDATWLTATTVATVGYGDLSAKTTEGRWATILLLYGPGIVALARIGALSLDLAQQHKQNILNGKRSWKMDNHIVIFNKPKENGELYLKRMVEDLRSSELPEAQKAILIVSDQFENGISDELRALNVAHVNQHVGSQKAFDSSNLKGASKIIILSHDENELKSDSVTLDLVLRAREENPTAQIIAEVILDSNKDRILKAGADFVLKPMRTYPSVLAREILTPGNSALIESLSDSAGEECVFYPLSLKGTWGQVAGHVIQQDIGTPLGVLSADNKQVTNLRRDTDVTGAKGVYVIAPHGQILSQNDATRKLKGLCLNS